MKRFFGFILLIVALFFAGVALSMFIDAMTGENVSNSVGGGVFLLAIATTTGYGSLRCFRRRPEKTPPPKKENPERLILRLANKCGGKLTQTEVALSLGMSVDEAREALDDLAEKGAAELEVSSSGALVYAFPGLLSEQEKAEAKPVSEA